MNRGKLALIVVVIYVVVSLAFVVYELRKGLGENNYGYIDR